MFLVDRMGAHLAAVIDCHNGEVIGYEFAMRSRAKEAERGQKQPVSHGRRAAASGGPQFSGATMAHLPESVISASLSGPCLQDTLETAVE